MLKVQWDNRDGRVWDVSELVTEASWQTARVGKAGSLEMTIVKKTSGSFACQPGDIVSVTYRDRPMFYGTVFAVETGSREEVRVKAYDQIRYLLNTDTYVFKNVTATDVIRRVAGDAGLQVGRLAETPHRMAKLVEDNKTLLDMIDKALALTLVHANRMYVFYDDFGALTLRPVEETLTDFWIGDESLLVDYSFSRDIDSDTYNRIKLARDNAKTGRREVYIAQDSANIARWGRLQYFEKVDEDQNPAQIDARLQNLMALKNRETRSLRLEALGDIRVRAGIYLRVLIGEMGLNRPFLVETCTHRFKGAEHTMTLELNTAG